MIAANNGVGLSESKAGIRFIALGLVLVSLASILIYRFSTRHDQISDEASIAERIQPVADLELAPSPAATTEKGKRAGALLVHQACRSCHSTGQGGAPKIGDRKAWAPRLTQELDTLVRSVVSGKCRMPRGSSDADEMELARAVVYMIWPRMRL